VRERDRQKDETEVDRAPLGNSNRQEGNKERTYVRVGIEKIGNTEKEINTDVARLFNFFQEFRGSRRGTWDVALSRIHLVGDSDK
jgi:hypothetical protein